VCKFLQWSFLYQKWRKRAEITLKVQVFWLKLNGGCVFGVEASFFDDSIPKMVILLPKIGNKYPKREKAHSF
jgi:hypothetical protein